MKHRTCKARPGHQLTRHGVRVTDKPSGVRLPNSSAVRDDLRTGRLLEVLPAAAEATKRTKRTKE